MTALLLAGLLLSAVPSAGAPPVADEIHYTFTGDASVAFDWRGRAGDISFGTTSAYDTTVIGHAPTPLPVSSSGPFWEAELTGLAPDTQYHYSIGGGPDQTFTTQPTGDFRFDVTADIGSSLDSPQTAMIQGQIAADNPAFVLVAGDMGYADNHGAASVDQHFNDVMTWSRNAAYMPTWGNHDWDEVVDDLREYKGRFALENAQASPGAPASSCCGEDWSWFDAGGVRFISFPEPYTSATWADWRLHTEALMAEAQADPAINFIVTWGHRPAYSTGYHAGNTDLAPILDALGDAYPKYVVDMSGHSHDYERFAPIHGVVHIVTGGGGEGLEIPWSYSDPSIVSRALHLEYLRVDVTATSMTIEAVCGPASSRDDIVCTQGSVIDSVTFNTSIDPPGPTEFVGNPGFEVDTSGWSAKGGARAALHQATGGHTGAYAVRLDHHERNATLMLSLDDVPEWVAVTEIGRYQVSAWVRSDSFTGVARLRVREFQGGTRIGVRQRKITVSPTWQLIRLSYVAAAPGSSTLDLDVHAALSDTAALLVDDLSEMLP